MVVAVRGEEGPLAPPSKAATFSALRVAASTSAAALLASSSAAAFSAATRAAAASAAATLVASASACEARDARREVKHPAR